MASLTYHQPTFDLLKIEPEIDPAAVAALDALEQRRGMKLPASVREWYSIKNAASYLRGNDHPVKLQHLGSDIPEGETPAQMIILNENQAVCDWAVKLDDGDDPPVVTCYSHEENWQRFCDTFSHFCFMRVWDWAEHFPYWLEVIDFPLKAKIRNALAQIYTQKTATSANAEVPNIYRYGSESIRILIYEPHFHKGAKSWIMLMAASGEDILTAAKILFSDGDLPKMFWWETELNTANPIHQEQEAVLKQIRDWKAGS